MDVAARPIVPPVVVDTTKGSLRSSESSNALTRKLERFAPFGASARTALDELGESSDWIAAGAPILAEGETHDTVLPLLEGLAYRHKDFRDGRRQIITVLIPGDICGGDGPVRGPVHYGVRTLTRARVARIELDRFHTLLADHPAIVMALHRAALVDEAVLRAWIVNLGQRHAHERMAHLLCELAQRMKDCGLLLLHGGFNLPLTQHELGSALGLTSVHTNRVLQRLRAERLLDFHHGIVEIHDLARLITIADFDSGYLYN